MVFISHSSHDAAFVSELRQQLESFKLKAWVDCRELVAGNTLDKEIQQALAKQQQDKRFQVIGTLFNGREDFGQALLPRIVEYQCAGMCQ